MNWFRAYLILKSMQLPYAQLLLSIQRLSSALVVGKLHFKYWLTAEKTTKKLHHRGLSEWEPISVKYGRAFYRCCQRTEKHGFVDMWCYWELHRLGKLSASLFALNGASTRITKYVLSDSVGYATHSITGRLKLQVTDQNMPFSFVFRSHHIFLLTLRHVATGLNNAGARRGV